METYEYQDIIYSLAAANQGKQLWAARASGLYCSNDAGSTWWYAYQSLLGEQRLPTLAAALSPAFARDHTILAGVPGAVLTSTNGGKQWKVARLDSEKSIVNAIACSPRFEDDGTAFAVTGEDGVYCSYDYGSRWTNWNFGLLDTNGTCCAVSPDFGNDQTVWVGTSSGLFMSRNAGKSWQGVVLPCGYEPVLTIAADGQSLWIGTESNGLLRSEDGGNGWEPVGAGLPAGPINYLLIDPAAERMLVVVENTLFLSRDRGEHFTAQRTSSQVAGSEITAICSSGGLQPGANLYVATIESLATVSIEK